MAGMKLCSINNMLQVKTELVKHEEENISSTQKILQNISFVD